jgi:triphosphatase
LRQDLHTAPVFRPESHEIELKFLTTETGFKSSQNWPALTASPPAGNARRLVTRYFDTEHADLERRNMALRVRKQGRSYIMTLKWSGDFPGGMFERGEVEAASKGPEPDPALFGPECAAMLAEIIQGQPLIPVYETDIRRTTRRITSATSDIEIAFDAGFISAADQKSPVREIELELKSGDPAELYQLGMALADSYPVRLGMLAKSQRGVQLRTGEQPGVMRGITPLEGTPNVDEAIGAVINACLAQFTGNFPAFESGDAVNAVHQMRVAMRRLRSILKLFQRSFPCAEFTAFRNQAKQIATAMGEGRNWDVFQQLLRDGPAAAFPEQPGFEPIFAAAEQYRTAGYDLIGKLLASPETTRFVLSLQAFVARRGWRNALSAEALSRLTQPALDFAAFSLNRMHGKLVKRGKNLHKLSPHHRHQLRIGLKNIRYAGDLFGGLFENRTQLRDFLRHTARLQDQLGAYNDLVTAIDLLGHFDCATPSASYAAGIIAGWCRRGAVPDDEALLRAWKKFKKTKEFTV